MHPFGLTWVVCNIIRVTGYLLIGFSVYAFIPGTPLPQLATNLQPSLFAVMVLSYGVILVMGAESWMVWFQTERNTAEVANRLRRIEHLLERNARGSETLSEQELIRREIL